jgi:hypothetical protein
VNKFTVLEVGARWKVYELPAIREMEEAKVFSVLDIYAG